MALNQSEDRFNGVIASLAIKAPCKTVTDGVGNILLEGEQTINSIAVVVGDRVLVMEQTDPVENGIYNVRTSTWDRAADWDGNRDVVKGTLVTVNRPTNLLTSYVQVNLGVGQDEPTIDVDPVNFTVYFTQVSSLDDLDDVDLTGCTDDDLMYWSGGVLICTLGQLTWDGVTLTNFGPILVGGNNNKAGQLRDAESSNVVATLNPKANEPLTGWGGNNVGELTGILDDGGAGIRAMILNRPASGHTTRRWNRETITASTTQTQGNGQLSSSMVNVNVVANANDVVTLIDPQSALDHIVMNTGANTLQIFPASGHDLGNGTDSSMTLAVGASVWFLGVNSTTWLVNSIGTGPSGGAGGTPGVNGCKVSNNGAQAVADNTDVVVGWDTEAYDTNAFHDGGMDSRLTIPVGVTRVKLTSMVRWSPNGSSFRRVKIRKNGVFSGAVDDDMGGFQPRVSMVASLDPLNWNQFVCQTGVIRVDTADYFEVLVYQNSTVNVNMIGNQGWFQIEVLD